MANKKENVVIMPRTKQLDFGNLVLQMRLDAKTIMRIEDRLDESLMSLFMNGRGGMSLPSTKKLLIVLQGANQVSGVRDQDIFNAFEQYLDQGNTTMDLISEIQDLLYESGFFGKEDEKEDKKDKQDKEQEVSFDEETETDFVTE